MFWDLECLDHRWPKYLTEEPCNRGKLLSLLSPQLFRICDTGSALKGRGVPRTELQSGFHRPQEASDAERASVLFDDTTRRHTEYSAPPNRQYFYSLSPLFFSRRSLYFFLADTSHIESEMWENGCNPE